MHAGDSPDGREHGADVELPTALEEMRDLVEQERGVAPVDRDFLGSQPAPLADRRDSLADRPHGDDSEVGGLDRFGASNLRNVPYSAAQAVAFGLPAAEALRGLTLYPAEILGLSGRLGSLEVGKDATFFLADGDILDLRTSVRRLWIAGREVSLESRHTRLYERYRNRPRNP